VWSDADEYMARLRKYGTHPLNLHALLPSIIFIYADRINPNVTIRRVQPCLPDCVKAILTHMERLPIDPYNT
jgi:hypothetical protein